MKLLEPAACDVRVPEGRLENSSGKYVKHLSDLSGLYADKAAFDTLLKRDGDKIVYEVTEHRPSNSEGDLIFGVTRLSPGKIGREYFLTRGHIHQNANRSEIYYGESGKGVMLMESPEGEVRTVAIAPRVMCYVPPYWIHRSINVGSDDLVMTFAYPADAGQDYDVIARTGGMQQRIVDDGNGSWVAIANDAYRPRSASEIDAIFKKSYDLSQCVIPSK